MAGRPPKEWADARDVLIEEGQGHKGPQFKKAWEKYVASHKGDIPLREMPTGKDLHKSKKTKVEVSPEPTVSQEQASQVPTSPKPVLSVSEKWWITSNTRKALRQLDIDENDIMALKNAVMQDYEGIQRDTHSHTSKSKLDSEAGWKNLVLKLYSVMDQIIKKYDTSPHDKRKRDNEESSEEDEQLVWDTES